MNGVGIGTELTATAVRQTQTGLAAAAIVFCAAAVGLTTTLRASGYRFASTTARSLGATS